jgi:hypothetical protein
MRFPRKKRSNISDPSWTPSWQTESFSERSPPPSCRLPLFNKENLCPRGRLNWGTGRFRVLFLVEVFFPTSDSGLDLNDWLFCKTELLSTVLLTLGVFEEIHTAVSSRSIYQQETGSLKP